ncbi:MAG: hypothetical protein KGY70_18490 [Bacteroidales bacterium]|nr:hypothetical protein [Bacteroidales bacterium]
MRSSERRVRLSKRPVTSSKRAVRLSKRGARSFKRGMRSFERRVRLSKRAAGNSEWNEFYSVEQIGSGYILGGRTRKNTSDRDGWIVEIDQSGNKQWSRLFGGSKYDCILDFLQTADEGYILAGQTRSFGADHGDGWLIKTEAD